MCSHIILPIVPWHIILIYVKRLANEISISVFLSRFLYKNLIYWFDWLKLCGTILCGTHVRFERKVILLLKTDNFFKIFVVISQKLCHGDVCGKIVMGGKHIRYHKHTKFCQNLRDDPNFYSITIVTDAL